MKTKALTIEQLAQLIEDQNDYFQGLSKEEKKVVIAEDCLARIYAKQLVPYTSMFINHVENIKFIEQPLKSILNTPETKVKCEACAKGSLFLSMIGRMNEFNACDIDGKNNHDTPEHLKLLELFTMRELAYIEFAFEGKQYINNELPENNTVEGEEIIFTEEERKKAVDFYIKYGGQGYPYDGGVYFEPTTNEGYEEETQERLIKICENIITNKGQFIL